MSIAVFFLLFYFDVFNAQSVTAEHSKRLFYYWIAPWFSPEDLDQVSVVLLTEDDLDGHWPAPYGLHADVLEQILAYHPKQVMVDIGFIDPQRPDKTLSALIETVEKYKREDVPLFLAARETRAPVQPECPACTSADGLVDGILPPLAAAGAKPVSVYVTAGTDTRFSYRLAPLESGLCPAAAQMFYGDCSARERAGPLPPLEIHWGLYRPPDPQSAAAPQPPAPGQRFANGPLPCREGHARSGLPARLWPTIRLSLYPPPNRYTRIDLEALDTCPPMPTIGVSRLLFAGGYPALTSRGEPDCGTAAAPPDDGTVDPEVAFLDRRARALLCGKYVFYGASVAMLDDLVAPPTHTLQPGVIYHAMALANLLHHADPAANVSVSHYVRDDIDLLRLGGGHIKVVDVITFLLGSIAIILSACATERLQLAAAHLRPNCSWTNRPGNAPPCYRMARIFFVPLLAGLWVWEYAVLAAFVTAAAVVMDFILFYWLHLGPLNLVAVLGFIAISSLASLTEARARRGSPGCRCSGPRHCEPAIGPPQSQ